MINKIVNILAHDKLLHFIAGCLVAFFVGLLGLVLGSSDIVIFFSMCLGAGLAGVAKDYYDYKDYGRFDWYDVLATFLGGLFVGVVGFVF